MTSCLARNVMGARAYAEFIELDQTPDWVPCADVTRRHVSIGRHGSVEDERINLHCHHSRDLEESTFFWVDQSARLFVGTRQNNTLNLYTNVSDDRETWPSEVEAWLTWNAGEQFDALAVLNVHPSPLSFEAVCASSRQEYQRFLAVRDGETCDVRDVEAYRLRQEGHVVSRESRLRERAARSAEGPRLRVGDLVHLAELALALDHPDNGLMPVHREEFFCAYFRAESGEETMGWVEFDRLAGVGVSRHVVSRLPALEWPRFATSAEFGSIRVRGQFEFLGQMADEVRFSVDGLPSRSATAERILSFRSESDRTAHDVRGGQGHIVRLNNAIYVELLDPVRGVMDSAVFYPVPRPLELERP